MCVAGGKMMPQEPVISYSTKRFSSFRKLNQDGLTAQVLASYVGSIALSPLMLLPILVYAYDVHLGFGPDMAGWISSSAIIGLSIATVLVALRASHWNMGRISVYGMIIMLIFTMFTLISHQIIAIFISSFIAGFGGGLTQAAVAAALGRTKRYERSFAIFTSFQFFYPGIGAYIFPRLLQRPVTSLLHGFNGMQWGQSILILSGLLLAPIVGAFIYLPENGMSVDHSAEAKNLELKALTSLPAILSNIGICIYGGSNGAIFAYSEGIGRIADLDINRIGDIIAYANFAAGTAALGVAWIENRFGHYPPLITGILIQLISAIILYVFASEAGYITGMFVFTISWALVFPFFLSIQSQLDRSGSVVTFGQFANLVGTAAGPSIAAYWVGSKGHFVSAIWVAAVMTILSMLPMIAIRVVYKGQPK